MAFWTDSGKFSNPSQERDSKQGNVWALGLSWPRRRYFLWSTRLKRFSQVFLTRELACLLLFKWSRFSEAQNQRSKAFQGPVALPYTTRLLYLVHRVLPSPRRPGLSVYFPPAPFCIKSLSLSMRGILSRQQEKIIPQVTLKSLWCHWRSHCNKNIMRLKGLN